MFKHKFNIFPEMQGEEMQRLVADIQKYGFDTSQPVILFEGQILDGWNRFLAAETLGVEAQYKDFEGSEMEAINFVMRTNKRRNLTSQQWAAIAAEADSIIEILTVATESERRQKQAETQSKSYEAKNCLIEVSEEISELTYELDEKHDTRDKNKVSEKLAKTFNTNRTYIQEARKLKETEPEKFEELKQGKTTFQQIKKEKPTINEILDTDEADEWTRLCKDFGNRFQKAIREFEQVKDDMSRAFYNSPFPLSDFARNLLTTNLKMQSVDAKFLKTVIKCPNCKGKSCQYCKQGYITADQTESVLDMASYTGITFDDYMEAKNGTSTVSK